MISLITRGYGVAPLVITRGLGRTISPVIEEAKCWFRRVSLDRVFRKDSLSLVFRRKCDEN